jgi:hypothetical protein
VSQSQPQGAFPSFSSGYQKNPPGIDIDAEEEYKKIYNAS